jgi:hypothetical protein
MTLAKTWLTAVLVLILAAPGRGQVVPKPEDVLGFPVGADYHLATYAQAVDYLKRIASVSDRIRLFELGRTSMGRTMVYAVLSSPENLKALDRHKDIARRLSLAALPEDEAARLAAEGRAVVYIDGGLHADECAPAQHNIQLAYELVTAQDPRRLRILDDVILVLVFANPDGMDLLAEWYHPNVGTPYEVAPMPRLYQKYAGHDNNRDGYIANLVETQHLSRLVNREWFPVIAYNHHQTAPFPARIWTPPNSEPTNPNVHPLIVRWQNLIGSAMGASFDAEGKGGAISRIMFDTWYPGYMTQVHDSHNIISILTETALYRYATPHFYTVRDFPKEYRDLTMSAFYPSPWKGGWWRLKDAVDYCLTASLAVLETASKYRSELLFNKYRMAREVVARFEKEPPFAWIVPEKQRDPGAAALLLNRMILLGVDVYRSEEPFTSDGVAYPKGTFVLPVAQPNGLFLKNVFEEQKYPDLRKYPDLWQGIVQSRAFEGAPFESYDMMGWTLPYQFGMSAVAAGTPLTVRKTLQQDVRFVEGGVEGSGGAGWLIDPAANAGAAAANRALKAGGRVVRTKKALSAGGRDYPAGTFFVSSRGLDAGFMNKTAKEFGLRPLAVSAAPAVETTVLRRPRLGVYQSWIPSEEEGWLRLVLEQHDFAFTTLHDADVRAGDLRSNFDVLVLPDHYDVDIIVDGYDKGSMPPAYEGGLGARGVANIKAFAEAGGTVILVNGACNLAADRFGLPLRNVLKNAKPEEFNCGGSLLRVTFDASHPVAYGMPEDGAAVFSSSCAFDLLPSFEAGRETKSVATYAEEGLLMSGWIHGERLIQRKSAVAEARLGKGRVLLLGFPATFRAQPLGTFKLLFNGIFYGASEAEAAAK